MHSTVSSEIITILFCPLFLGVVVEEFCSFLCLPLEFGGGGRFFLPSKTEEFVSFRRLLAGMENFLKFT